MRRALLLLCVPLAASAAPCDNATLDKVIAAMPKVPAEMRVQLLVTGIGEGCPGPNIIPTVQAPAAQRPVLLAKYVRDNPAEWTAGCPAGIGVMRTLATVASADRVKAVHSKCQLADHGWSVADAENMGDDLLYGILMAGRTKDADPARRAALLASFVPKQP